MWICIINRTLYLFGINMEILLTILYCLIVLSILVFIHEGGHFLSAKIFGIRVTEFMLGLPGPKISFKFKGTRFGVTCIPLGGYARVCGMEPGNLKKYTPEVLEYVHKNGKASIKEVCRALCIKEDDADEALEELVDWGSIVRAKSSEYESDNILYYAADINGYKKGEARNVDNKEEYFKNEYFCQYRSLPFWKRSVIVLAGILINILFAMVVFVILYSIIGFDAKNASGEIFHKTMSPIEAIQYGFNYIWAVIVAVAGLFNPTTAAETVSNSTSLIGIAVISKNAAEAGICAFLEFMAMISVSLGIMNLLPIPPLDGGRFLIEIYQAVFKRNVPEKALTIISFIGIALFVLLFIVITNQDIQRFILGG